MSIFFARTRATLDAADMLAEEASIERIVAECGSLEARLTRGMGRAHLDTPIPSAVSGHGAPAEVIPTYEGGHEAGCSIWWGEDGVCDCAPSEACGCEDLSDHVHASSLPVTHPAYCDGSPMEAPIGGPNGCFCEGPCGHEFI